jgi:hypothetical protein
MKKLAYIIMLAFIIASCSNKEDLNSPVELENQFAITDNASDLVQHTRYEIYKEYNVPVYFNDTINVTQKTTDYYGKPVYQYETVDLNWGFTSYNTGASYKYDYLTNQADQLQALSFVKAFLNKASKQMRPFSILLVDTLTASSSSKTEKPVFYNGYRTLVFSQLKGINTESKVDSLSDEIIRSMVKSKVNDNLTLCTKFNSVSSKKQYYGKKWTVLGVTDKWILKGYWNLDPANFFLDDDDPDSFVASIAEYDESLTLEERHTIRDNAVKAIGEYGFICGDENLGYYKSPANADYDRDYFVTELLKDGDKVFRERYGKCTLVMEKYTLLYDFITNELGVKL